jgi:ribose 5-phosphate isomerase A
MSQESIAKRVAGYAAADLIESGMTVGIGTGTTARFFILRLAERCREGLSIVGVPTSIATLKLCQEADLPTRDLDEVDTIDVAVDGADEIDSQGRMIKGGGGALVREKLIATHSQQMLVIIDATKRVRQLGRFGLPIALLPFGAQHTLRLVRDCGYPAVLRKKNTGEPVFDDNGLAIADIPFPNGCTAPEKVHAELSALPGLVETGFFLTQASRLIVGYDDGRVEIEEVTNPVK